MIQVSGFGEVGSTIAETVGAGKVYRGHLEDRLREKHDVRQKVKNLLVNGVFFNCLGSGRGLSGIADHVPFQPANDHTDLQRTTTG